MNYIAYPDIATNNHYRLFVNKFLNEKNIKAPAINPDLYFKLINDKLGITPDQIKSKSRERDIVEARYILFYLVNRDSTIGLKKIGKLANRDHATVIHGLRTVRNIVDRGFKRKMEMFT